MEFLSFAYFYSLILISQIIKIECTKDSFDDCLAGNNLLWNVQVHCNDGKAI